MLMVTCIDGNIHNDKKASQNNSIKIRLIK